MDTCELERELVINRMMYRHLYFLYTWKEARDQPDAPPQMRYRLEDAITHEQYLFVEPSALVEFLRAPRPSQSDNSTDRRVLDVPCDDALTRKLR